MEKIFYRPAEAAAALGLSKSLVYQLIAAGTLASARVGRAVLVPAESLRAFAEARTKPAEVA
jgi:excisionase family DNA binding protein